MWYSRIFVAYDGSAQARKAVRVACELGEQNPQAHITFAHVTTLDGGSGAAGQGVFDRAAAIQADLEQLASELPNQAEVRMLTGTSPAELLLRAADEAQADLIVMGSRGMGGVKGYLGSVSVAVVQRARAYVLIVKED